MGTIITFGSEKGGIGKSSLAFNISWYLSDKKKKILLIDLDAQRANLTRYCNVKDIEYTIVDCFKEGFDAHKAIRNIKKNLDIIPANNDLQGLSQSHKVSTMKKILSSVRDEYDLVYIDIPPSPSWVHVLALSVSDSILIPMLPDVASIDAVNGIKESIEEIQDTMNPSLKVLGIVFNRYTQRTNLSKDVKNFSTELAKGMNTVVFKHGVRDTVVFSETLAYHKGITETAPKSNGAADIVAVSEEFLKEVKKNAK